MLKESDRLTLRSIFLFGGMTDDELRDFCESDLCSTFAAQKGELIFGGCRDRLGILLSGRAVAEPTDQTKSALKTFSAGELFGAASIFCDGDCPPLSRIVAKTACRVLYVSREGVERILRRHPETAVGYIRFLSGRVEFLNRRISTFTKNEAAKRVAEYLLRSADESDRCKNLNFSALAKTLGISRASLYRVRSELIEFNAISVEGRTVTLLDKEALKNIK